MSVGDVLWRCTRLLLVLLAMCLVGDVPVLVCCVCGLGVLYVKFLRSIMLVVDVGFVFSSSLAVTASLPLFLPAEAGAFYPDARMSHDAWAIYCIYALLLYLRASKRGTHSSSFFRDRLNSMSVGCRIYLWLGRCRAAKARKSVEVAPRPKVTPPAPRHPVPASARPQFQFCLFYLVFIQSTVRSLFLHFRRCCCFFVFNGV